MKYLMTPFVAKAMAFAEKRHGKQLYGEEFPYIVHLLSVYEVLFYNYDVRDPDILAAALLHDVLEDTETIKEELRTLFGTKVSDIVECLTEPRKGNRKSRHEVTLPKIRNNKDAVMVKLADRIANVEMGGKKVQMYVKEHKEFKEYLYRPNEYEDMWNYLDLLIIESIND